MEYQLRGMGKRGSNILKIQKAEYESIKLARSALSEIHGVEEKFDMLMENYVELEESLLRISLRYLAFTLHDDAQFRYTRNVIARRLLNMLASGALYRSTLPQHAAKLGKASDTVKRGLEGFERHCGDQRTTGYRLVEAIRNYAQHRDLAVHLFSIGGRWEDTAAGRRNAFSVEPKITPRTLLVENRKIDPELKSAILEMPENVELMPLVREYVEVSAATHEKFRALVGAVVQKWEGELEDAMKRYEAAFPNLGTWLLQASPVSNGKILPELIDLFERMFEYRRHLQDKTRTGANLSKRYVKW